MIEILFELKARVDTRPSASTLHKTVIVVKEGHEHLILPRLLKVAENAMREAAKKMDEELVEELSNDSD